MREFLVLGALRRSFERNPNALFYFLILMGVGLAVAICVGIAVNQYQRKRRAELAATLAALENFTAHLVYVTYSTRWLAVDNERHCVAWCESTTPTIVPATDLIGSTVVARCHAGTYTYEAMNRKHTAEGILGEISLTVRALGNRQFQIILFARDDEAASDVKEFLLALRNAFLLQACIGGQMLFAGDVVDRKLPQLFSYLGDEGADYVNMLVCGMPSLAELPKTIVPMRRPRTSPQGLFDGSEAVLDMPAETNPESLVDGREAWYSRAAILANLDQDDTVVAKRLLSAYQASAIAQLQALEPCRKCGLRGFRFDYANYKSSWSEAHWKPWRCLRCDSHELKGFQVHL